MATANFTTKPPMLDVKVIPRDLMKAALLPLFILRNDRYQFKVLIACAQRATGGSSNSAIVIDDSDETETPETPSKKRKHGSSTKRET
jgi:hypothetical protein